MVSPSSTNIPLDPRIEGNRVIVPVEHLSNREQRTSRMAIMRRLGKRMHVALANGELICKVNAVGGNHRKNVVKKVKEQVCSIIRRTVTSLREQYARQQPGKPRTIDIQPTTSSPRSANRARTRAGRIAYQN
jgi:hypothetical protein